MINFGARPLEPTIVLRMCRWVRSRYLVATPRGRVTKGGRRGSRREEAETPEGARRGHSEALRNR